MWDTIKVIIGLCIMVILGGIIFVVATLLSPLNPAEVAQGLPAVPVIVIVGLVIVLIMEFKDK